MSEPMTPERLVAAFQEAGFRVAYDHFNELPEVPFVLIWRDRSANTYADDQVYRKENIWNVVLCSDDKSPELEEAVERVLDEAGVVYENVGESFIEDERLYENFYETGVC